VLQRRDLDTPQGAKHAVQIPHTMLAATIHRFSGPEVLTLLAPPRRVASCRTACYIVGGLSVARARSFTLSIRR